MVVLVLGVLPMSGNEAPASLGLDPPSGDVVPVGPFGLPMALRPDVLVAIPRPVAWCPDIAGLRWGDDFVTDRWRWRADDDIDGDLCRRGERPSRAAAEREERHH
jgi:hypothetical protein